MHKIIGFLFLSLSLAMLSCEDEENVYPQIETLEVTPTFASSFLAKGNIKVIGNATVLDYGFVYGTSSNPDILQSTKVGFGPTTTAGPFEKNISIQYPGQPSIYLRTYITNEKGTVYGEVKEFPLPILTAASVSPMKGRAGTQVTIAGLNFSIEDGGNEVKFNDKIAAVVSATTTALVVEIPDGITDPIYYQSVTIKVNTGGQEVIATETFRVLPTIIDFSPNNGTFGTTVVLSGKDFSPVSAIKIGGKDASAFSISYGSLSFNVPPTVTTSKLKITLVMEDETVEVPGEFTINNPTITTIAPMVGLGGSQVAITGTGFNIGDFLFSYNTVKFGNIEAVAFNSAPDEIIAYVPPGLSPGTYKISVFTGVHTVTYGPNYTLATPTISGFSPTSGVAGTYVTINGNNFGEFRPGYTVLFGSTPVDIFSWHNTAITVTIPVGTAPGTYKITVNVAGQSITSGADYTILP